MSNPNKIPFNTDLTSREVVQTCYDPIAEAHRFLTVDSSGAASGAVPNWARYTDPENLITSPQDFTGAWVDLGPEIDMRGFTRLNAMTTITNTGTGAGFQIRALAKFESAGADEFSLPIETSSSTEISVAEEYFKYAQDTSQKLVIKARPEGSPYIQLQIQATTPGTPVAQMSACVINKLYMGG